MIFVAHHCRLSSRKESQYRYSVAIRHTACPGQRLALYCGDYSLLLERDSKAVLAAITQRQHELSSLLRPGLLGLRDVGVAVGDRIVLQPALTRGDGVEHLANQVGVGPSAHEFCRGDHVETLRSCQGEDNRDRLPSLRHVQSVIAHRTKESCKREAGALRVTERERREGVGSFAKVNPNGSGPVGVVVTATSEGPAPLPNERPSVVFPMVAEPVPLLSSKIA